MSQAAVSIYADIVVRPDRAKIDAAAKEARELLMKAFGGGSATMTAIPINFDIPKDSLQKLQAKLNAMTFTANVDFVPRGGIPSHGMNGPLPQIPGGMTPIPGMSGALSPNWSYILRQQQQKIIERTVANQISEVGTASPDASVAQSTSSNSGGRSGNTYNPFSPKGIARAVGSGLAVYGGILAAHLATGMFNADETLNHPERILRGMENVGSVHNVGNDPFMRTQAQLSAVNQSQTEFKSAIEGVPVIGSLAKLAHAIDGTTKELEDGAKQISKTTEIYKYAQGQMDEAKRSRANLTRDPRIAMAESHRIERERDDSDLAAAKHNFLAATTKTESDSALVALNSIKRVISQREKNRLSETDWSQRDIDADDMRSANKILSGKSTSRSIDSERAGHPMEAMQRERDEKLRQFKANYEAEMKKASPLEKKRLEKEFPGAVYVMGKKLDFDIFKAQKAMNLEMGNIDARTQSITASAKEGLISASGASGESERQSVSRETLEHVNALKREAEAAINSTKATKLLTEALAEEGAGADRLKAIRISSIREGMLENRKATEDREVARMETGGHNYGAAQKSITDRYGQEADAIRLKQLDPKAEREQIEAAKQHRDSALSDLKAGRVRSNIAMEIQGQDAAARSRGQEGVGGVLSFEEEIRQKYRDAMVEDPKTGEMVLDQEQAAKVADWQRSEVLARRRELRPRDAGMKYGGVEYHDILQQQINSGFGHSEAMQKLSEAAQIDGMNAGTPEAAEQKTAADLSKAAAGLQKAADTFLRRKAV